MSDKFRSVIENALRKNKATFDEDEYILRVNHVDGESFEIDLKNLRDSKKNESTQNTINFR
jgi:hypothetical protein